MIPNPGSEFEKTLNFLDIHTNSSLSKLRGFISLFLSRIFPNKLAGNRKAGQNSIEVEHRNQLELFLNDMLIVFGKPDWPASIPIALEIQKILVKFYSYQIQVCESSETDDNPLKRIIIKWIGNFALKIREFKSDELRCKFEALGLPPFDPFKMKVTFSSATISNICQDFLDLKSWMQKFTHYTQIDMTV
jgi:hypothetical protein